MRQDQHPIGNKKGITVPTLPTWLDNLQSFDQTQLSFHNTTEEAQPLTLWGKTPIAPMSAKAKTITTGISPQAIAYNSWNNQLYVVNQLGGSITVVSPGQSTGTSIELAEPNEYPSPVDIAINPSDGSVYVIGSLSNKLYHIDENLSVKQEIELDNRPISIALNPLNQKLYISHLLTPQVSVVRLNDLMIEERLATEEVATTLAVNELNGNWAAVLSESHTLQLFNRENQSLGRITEVGTNPVKALYDAAQNRLLVIASSSKELLQIDTVESSITKRFQYDHTPVALTMDEHQQIYVGLQETNTLLVYNQALELTQRKTLESMHDSVYVDADQAVIYLPQPTQSTLRIEAINTNETPVIVVPNDYPEIQKDFQYKPARIAHVRVQFSGVVLAPVFRIGRDSTRGKRSSRVISLNKFSSPQHFSPIFEVTDFKDEIIDGTTFWEITLPPEQHLSLLLYYTQ